MTLGGILLFLFICGSLSILLNLLPSSMPAAGDNLVITLIPVSTFTPTATRGDTEFEQTPTPTAQNVAGLQIGDYVKVIGTEGAGLRIRSEAGLNASVNFIGMDDELFVISDGPVEASGYTWWYVVAPYDDTRSGWAASNFMTRIEGQ